jgi:short-subunit dehydrogenase
MIAGRRYTSLMRKNALITGASGGLGECFARLAAADGYDLFLLARGKDALHALADELTKTHHIRTTVLVEDLSDPDSCERIAAKLAVVPLDLLVNNAGFGDFGTFSTSDPLRDAAMIQVNVGSLTRLTRLLLPGMLARKTGRILNVASTASFAPGPLMAVYYATKAYVLSFSVALSDETSGSGVTVTCLCPGPTATGFERAANLRASRLFKRGTMDADTVARMGYKACLAGKPLLVAGLRNKILIFGTRLVPKIWAARIARKAQSPS